MSGWREKIFSILGDKEKILIVGGTGTLGKALLSIIPISSEITVLSREEIKQQQLKRLFPKVKFVIGDIRDYESLKPHFLGKTTVFHLAAMKHVDVAEENPEEAIKINLLGSLNVAKACIESNVGYCAFSSTDKAVLPINTYGMCKGVSEKYYFHLNKTQDITRFSVFRWGNVLGSRGSVLHSFLESLKTKKEVNITDARMTRFWVDIKDVARFILDRYEDAPKDEALIPPMKASRVIKLAELCARSLGLNNYKINYTGIRPGEKIHECLRSEHDFCVRSDTIEHYSDEEILEMIERASA